MPGHTGAPVQLNKKTSSQSSGSRAMSSYSPAKRMKTCIPTQSSQTNKKTPPRKTPSSAIAYNTRSKTPTKGPVVTNTRTKTLGLKNRGWIWSSSIF